jgi:hypothetical protein
MPVGNPNRNTEQRADDRPVGSVRPALWKAHHPPALDELEKRVCRDERRGDDRSHCSTCGAESRDRTEPANQHDVEADVQDRHRDAQTQRRFRIARGAQRAAEHEKQQHAETVQEHDPQIRKRFALNFGGCVDQIEQHGREEPAERRKDAERERSGGQERLVHGAIDGFVIVRAREARDQHAHSGKQR